MQDPLLNTRIEAVESKLTQLEQMLSSPIQSNGDQATIDKLKEEIELARQLRANLQEYLSSYHDR